MSKYRFGKPYVRRLRPDDIPESEQAKWAISYINHPQHHLSTTKAYAVCMHGFKGVFQVCLCKRSLMKLVKMTQSEA
ncbi:hypothetical protein NAB31_12415 [Proteus mirabilis]|uniref:hypothetical protein n=1 Tax=Proteus mirabilis TaxID=584 RepID=UPI00202485F6|nr:hypothetical protein [Proteus mirabilis]MCL8609772.1 hypothetical protein [Proteus mirabilis]HEK2727484.1 hypothetical protein [Proteus mirabilis]